MSRTWLLLALVTGTVSCGRLAFDPASDASIDPPDARVPVVVQRASTGLAVTTMLSVSLPAAPASGNLLVLVGSANIASLASVSGGSAGWTRAAVSTTYPNIEIWYGAPDGSSTVITTASGTTGMTLWVSEWSGLDPTSPLDAAIAMSGTTSPAVAGPITTTHAPDLLIFGVNDYLPNTFGAPVGGTWIALDTVMSNSVLSIWYAITTASGEHDGEVSETNHQWDAAIAAFRNAP